MACVVAVGTSIPEFVATNEYVISLAVEASKRTYEGSIDELEQHIRSFLAKTGARQRRWRSGFSKPFEHVNDAWNNCLAGLDGKSRENIGALIYCGIDRGFAEPSHASIIAQKFGLHGVRTFDISDACMGWFTALQIGSALGTADKPYTAIVSAEFPIEMPGRVYPAAFTIKNAEDFRWKGAALTLGEAASVTIIQSSGPVSNVFKSNSKFADLCCVPLIRPERFLDSSRVLPRLTDECFVAYMPTMASSTYRDAQEVLSNYVRQNGSPDIVLPHTVSQTGPMRAAKNLIKDGALRNCFELFGNIATCSIPIGYEYFDCAVNGAEHVIGWISAAGMNHCAFRLT